MKSTNIIKNNDWIIIDAENQILGRFASKISMLLTGKNMTNYSRNEIHGYKIIIINAKKIIVTGNKINNKVYYRHSGYPGGLKKITFKNLINSNVAFIIKNAIKGMLPKNKLQKVLLSRIRIFPESHHIHTAQKPLNIEF